MTAANQTATNVEAFVENQFALSHDLTLVTGASAAHNQRRSQSTFGPTPNYDLGYHRVMPKLGFRWDARRLQVYANMSGS